MTSVRNRLERLDAASSAHDRQHYARESDVSVHEVPAAFGAHRMTRYVYGRKLDPIARASGAGLAAGFRCESLSRLASRHRSRERPERSEEHTSELQSLMRISYAVFCLKQKKCIYQIIMFNQLNK